MKQNPPRLFLTGRPLAFLAFSLLSAAASPAWAQTIPNPGFEEDFFGFYPGYVSLNGPITGWTGSPDANYGLNPAETSPFADNGLVPEGTNVALIQSTVSDTITELATEISGLTTGTQYRLSFRVNVRAGGFNGALPPVLSVTIGDQEVFSATAQPVYGTAPYHYFYVDFNAAGPQTALVLRNGQTGSDSTLLVDDFKVVPTPAADPNWSIGTWDDDASSGVDPTYRYTHAYSLGTANGTTINDIPFKAVEGIAPVEAGKFLLSAMGAIYPDDSNNSLFEGSFELGRSFLYGGNPGVLTLQGLTPGKQYVLTFYSTGWEEQGKRPVMFSNGENRFYADQDTYGHNAGIRIIHTYTASPDGTGTVSFQGLGGTFHLCGFSNREAVKEVTAAPELSVQPVGKTALIGDTVTLTAGATGIPVPTYQWLFNGVEIAGATTGNLEINVLDATQAGFYALRATNSAGAVTSGGAYLKILEPQTSGPLFSTGVDESGFQLAEGAEDPHYTLVENQDGEINIPAVVETPPPNAWLANDTHSMWVGPLQDTKDSPVGRFTYRTTADIGANPATAVLAGFWATDNTGVEIRVNDQVVTGIAQSPGFASYTPFFITQANAPSLKAGVNTVDFVTGNITDPGYTGLRVFSAKPPAGIPAVVVTPPQGREATTGDTVAFNADGYGTAPVTYAWFKDGVAIPGATGPSLTLTGVSAANSGNYTVSAVNPLGTSAPSAPAALRILSQVPGFGSTGLAADGTQLEDGAEDTRYVLTVNPDGAADVPAVVHDTAIPLIATGPWLGVSDTSKWISSRMDSAQAAGGDYVYRTTLNLTGFEPASTVITGSWTSDNIGKAIRVNGAATGLSNTGTFEALTPFRIDDSNANFVSGVNTIEFVVENTTSGYTALRVDGLRALAAGGTSTGTIPTVTIQLSGTGKPVLSVTGTAGVTYTIQRSVTLGTAASPWASVGQALIPAGGTVQFEDSTAPEGRAFYRVQVP